jgi:hypothetical protein
VSASPLKTGTGLCACLCAPQHCGIELMESERILFVIIPDGMRSVKYEERRRIAPTAALVCGEGVARGTRPRILGVVRKQSLYAPRVQAQKANEHVRKAVLV